MAGLWLSAQPTKNKSIIRGHRRALCKSVDLKMYMYV